MPPMRLGLQSSAFRGMGSDGTATTVSKQKVLDMNEIFYLLLLSVSQNTRQEKIWGN